MRYNVKEMCLEVAFKTGKSRRRSDRLHETVPDHRTGNSKGSVSELGVRKKFAHSCCIAVLMAGNHVA